MPEAAPLALVLLPGLDGTGLMFGPLLPFLEGFEARVLRYPAALSAYADCLAFARARLPADRPFLLLAESFSGPIALALAAEAPPGLAGVALCATFARNPRPGLAWAAPLLRALPPLRLPSILIRLLLLGRGTPGPLEGLIRTLRSEVPAATLKGRLLAVLALDPAPRLAPLRVPALALRARRDRLVPPAATRWMETRLPGLEVLVLEGPHWLLQARPEACARALRAFAEGLRKDP
jgi:pimeloyl-[acyl-carrier protein] methyl ester esterase